MWKTIELHFFFIRATYKLLRDKLFPFDAYTIYDPMKTFISLLNDNDTTNIRNIATYYSY